MKNRTSEHGITTGLPRMRSDVNWWQVKHMTEPMVELLEEFQLHQHGRPEACRIQLFLMLFGQLDRSLKSHDGSDDENVAAVMISQRKGGQRQALTNDAVCALTSGRRRTAVRRSCTK